jgi:hypothetical protein
MSAAAEHCFQSKGQRPPLASNTVSRPKQYEDRVDRALLYPTRNKRESRQSDFTGVVRLSGKGKRYWVNVWASDTYRLRLSERSGLLKTPICRLAPVGPDLYRGGLALSDEDSSRQFMLHVDLQETGQRLLEIRFDAVARRAE